MQKLVHHFLLATPQIDTGVFQQSLVYVCRQDKQGTLGLVMNKAISYSNIAKLFEELDIHITTPNLYRKKPLAGGPINPEVGFVLHTGQPVWMSSFVITENLCITTSKDILHNIATGQGVEHFELCLGHSSWRIGQLEQEIARGDWLVVPADFNVLFNTPIEQRYQAVADLVGIDFNIFSTEIGHA